MYAEDALSLGDTRRRRDRRGPVRVWHWRAILTQGVAITSARTQQLLDRRAQNLLGGRVRRHDDSGRVKNEDAGAYRLVHGTQDALGLCQRFGALLGFARKSLHRDSCARV